VDECRGFGHVTLNVVLLPERKHKDGNFGLEDREGEEFESERGVTEREETAIEGSSSVILYLTLCEAIEWCAMI